MGEGQEGSWTGVARPGAGCQEETAWGGPRLSPPGGADWPGSRLHLVYKSRGEGDLIPILQVGVVVVEGYSPCFYKYGW